MKVLDYLFVEKYYKMDPMLVDVLANGRELKNGMSVLTESPHYRVSITALENLETSREPLFQEALDQALKFNRWCEVSKVEVFDDEVAFIGIFDDGRKRQLRAPVMDAWYVVIDSVPREIKVVLTEEDLLEGDWYVVDNGVGLEYVKREDILPTATFTVPAGNEPQNLEAMKKLMKNTRVV